MSDVAPAQRLERLERELVACNSARDLLHRHVEAVEQQRDEAHALLLAITHCTDLAAMGGLMKRAKRLLESAPRPRRSPW